MRYDFMLIKTGVRSGGSERELHRACFFAKLLINISTVPLSDSARRRYWIGLTKIHCLHRLHEHAQKDKMSRNILGRI